MQFKRGQAGIPNLFSNCESCSKACVPSDLWGEKPKDYVLGCVFLPYLQSVSRYEVLYQVLGNNCVFGMRE